MASTYQTADTMLPLRAAFLIHLCLLLWSCDTAGERTGDDPQDSGVATVEHPVGKALDSGVAQLVDCRALLEQQQGEIDRKRPVPEGYLSEDFAPVHDSIACNGIEFLLGYGWSYDTVRLAWCHEGIPHSILLDEIRVYARWWVEGVPKDQFGVLKVFDRSTAYHYDDLYIIDCGGAKPTVALLIRESMWNLGPDGLQTVDNSTISLHDLSIRDTTTRIWGLTDSIEMEALPPRSLRFDPERRIYFERLTFLDTVRFVDDRGRARRVVIRDSLPMVRYSFSNDLGMVYWRERWWLSSEEGSQLQPAYRVSSGF